MNRDHYTYGPAVLDGMLRYVSPSAMDAADAARSISGCLRRWYYRYVGGIKEPFGAAQAQGVEGHGQIETYLTTGQDMLGPVARRALHAIPKPGPDLEVEVPLVPWPADPLPFGRHDFRGGACVRCGQAYVHRWYHGIGPDASLHQGNAEVLARVPQEACPGKIPVDPAGSVLSIEGIPVVGYVDLKHRRRECQGASDISEAYDPAGTVEVRDWKFTGNVERNAKSREEVLAATPMVAYGEAAAREAITAHVRLTHVYISTGRPEPARVVTGRLKREEVARRWEQRAPLARMIRDAAREADPNLVDANTRACNAYRGCPHRTYCRAGQLGTLASMFDTPTIPKEQEKMSVLDLMKKPPAAAPAVPVPVAPPAVAAPAAPPPAATVAPQAAGEVTTFAEACRALDAASTRLAPDGQPFGWPPIAGDVAAKKAAMGGFTYTPGTGYGGSGKLGGLPWVRDVAQFVALARDVAHAAGLNAPAPVAVAVPDPAIPVHAAERAAAQVPAPILPPDAPASNPTIAALPVTIAPEEIGAPWVGHVQAKMAEMTAATAPPTPPSAQGLTTEQATAVLAATPPPAEKPKRTRAKKVDAPVPGGEVAAPAPGVYLHVDAVPLGPYEDLSTYVDEWTRMICEHYPESNGPAVDIRCSGREELGFGKWKGVLAAFARESVRTGRLPPGAYFLRARGSDVGSVVAEALRGVVDGGSWGIS